MPAPPTTDFAAFSERHLSRLAQVADLFTGERTEADQVTVDAFTELYRIWPGVSRSRDPLGAARRCLTAAYLRSTRRRGRTGQGAAALELADTFGAAPEVPRGADASWEAVLDLAPRDRVALVWLLFEHLPDSAVARTLTMTPRLVGRSARRGLDHVGMTVGSTAGDEIAGRQDTGAHERIQAQVAACFEGRHRGESDAEPLRTRIRAATAGVAARRYRTRSALLSGAAAALVAAGAVTVRIWPDQPPGQTAAQEPPPPWPSLPAAPPGARLVGYGDVVVAVPTGWGHNKTCSGSARDTVIYPDAATRTCATYVDASTVTFADPSPYPPPFRDPPERVGRAGGHIVLGTAVTHRDAVYQQSVLVPISGFSMVVRSPDKSVVLNVTASLQVVPRGFAVVPPCRGQGLRDATADLVEAGLKPVIKRASALSDSSRPQPPVSFQGTDSGRLVPIGSPVALFLHSS